MSERIVSIDTTVFEEITNGIATDGASCAINKEILNFKRNTTESDIGSLLYSYLEELCDCSQLYMEHLSEPLPTALNNLKESIVSADLKSAENIKLV